MDIDAVHSTSSRNATPFVESLSEDELWAILAGVGAISQDGHYKVAPTIHTRQVIWPHLVMQYASTHARRVAYALYERISDLKVSHVLSPSPSGQALGFAVADLFGARAIYATTGSDGRYQMLHPGFEIRRGDHVLIVDDGVYTGSTIADLQDIIRSSYSECIGVGVILDRNVTGMELAPRFEALLKVEIKVHEVYNTLTGTCKLCEWRKELEDELASTSIEGERERVRSQLGKLRVIDDRTFD